MGTNVTLGAAAGLETGRAVAGSALADGVTLDGAALDGAATDDELALQADSVSPAPRPSAGMPTTQIVRVKCRKLVITSRPLWG
jgi:hypothetical protein